MKCPPDIQVTATLSFLAHALRSDPEIARLTEAAPDEIVAATAEFQPIDRGPGGKLMLYQTELPALCLHIVNERFRPVQGTNPPVGREFTAWLWYLFAPFQAEDIETPGFAKNSRFCSLMWWRIQHYCYRHSMYTMAAGVDGPTWNLQDVGKIRLMEFDGPDERIELAEVEGIKIPIKIWHGNAPYHQIEPVTLEMISMTLTEQAGAGVGVSANVDV